MEPVKATGTPSEYAYNYWLLQKTYLFEDELDDLPETGDSTQELYNKLSDPYTRYIPPSKSEAATISLNTSIVEGDIGIELAAANTAFPLFVGRVYPESPAAKANVPRYGNIVSANGILLSSSSAYATYDSVLNYSAKVTLGIYHDSIITEYEMEKATVYAPTVFVDTIKDVIFVTITEFKLTTYDQQDGTLGELRSYLDSTQNYKKPRILDIRNNPGGHVNQCIPAADLFIKEGTLSTRSWRGFDGYGNNTYRKSEEIAQSGDAGENGKFAILANGGSASCAEIFAAAITELADIPLIGDTTFGKGIGQTNWSTIDGGLAIITNLEFLTPKGNSYHKKGLVPQYACESDVLSCAIEALDKHFGKTSSKKKSAISDIDLTPIHAKLKTYGGAYLDGDASEIPKFNF